MLPADWFWIRNGPHAQCPLRLVCRTRA